MEYLTTKQAGDVLGVNASRIRQLIDSEDLASIKIGRDQLVLASSVAKLARARAKAPVTKKGRPFKSAS